jgi:hypothetical protein
MEAVLTLATMAQHYRLRLAPGHPVVPQATLTLRPKHGMQMVVEARAAPVVQPERVQAAAVAA